MSRSIKKGPYVESALMKRIVEMNKSGKKNVVKTWSRSSTIFPDFVGHRRARWPQACSGLCDRGYGRSQAGRIRAHPYL